MSSYNDICEQLTDDIVVFLNNDIDPDPDFLDPLLDVFLNHEDAAFATTRGARSVATFRMGTLTAELTFRGSEQAMTRFGYTFNAGVGAFHRERFLALGGYDPLYLPGRYEDMDICFRAWKQGWKGYYEPKSYLGHEGGTSFKRRFTNKQIDQLVFRNSLFFMIKNITDPWIMAQFIFLTVVRVGIFLLRGRGHMGMALCEVLKRLPEVLQKRRSVMRQFKLGDREVIRMINQNILDGNRREA